MAVPEALLALLPLLDFVGRRLGVFVVDEHVAVEPAVLFAVVLPEVGPVLWDILEAVAFAHGSEGLADRVERLVCLEVDATVSPGCSVFVEVFAGFPVVFGRFAPKASNINFLVSVHRFFSLYFYYARKQLDFSPNYSATATVLLKKKSGPGLNQDLKRIGRPGGI